MSYKDLVLSIFDLIVGKLMLKVSKTFPFSGLFKLKIITIKSYLVLFLEPAIPELDLVKKEFFSE